MPDPVDERKPTLHDLRQPLATILALCAAARVQPGLPDVAAWCIDEIENETRAAAALCVIDLTTSAV